MKDRLAGNQQYFRQLDFLRFLAVAMVIGEHWFASVWTRQFELGYLGVLIFFVLSGFLISGILLQNKEGINSGKRRIGETLKIFYIRRSLRIFPVYYALLIFLFLFSFEGIRSKLGWYFFYGSNIYTYLQQAWDGMIGPLWSLAVEEQFYLVWPFLLLAIPVRSLQSFFLSCLVLAPVLRVFAVKGALGLPVDPDPAVSMRVLMPCCIDSFAIGGLLALWRNRENGPWNLVTIFTGRYAALASLFLSVVLLFNKETVFYYALFPTVFNFFALSLVAVLLTPVNGWMGNLVNQPALLYLGKISYGIYLFHGPFPLLFSIIDFALYKLGTGLSIYQSLNHLPEHTRHLVWVVYLVAFASLSYYLLERPFNNLKNKFSYT